MSKYTTKQKNEIYKKALELIDKNEFMCHALKDACGNWNINLRKHFPEFFLFEPKNLQTNVWPLCSAHACCSSEAFLNPRKTILCFCIAMTQ